MRKTKTESIPHAHHFKGDIPYSVEDPFINARRSNYNVGIYDTSTHGLILRKVKEHQHEKKPFNF